MFPWVVTLNGDLSPENVGTKAATLARLRGAGIPVPPGFCVSVAAFRAVTGVDPTEAAVLHAPLPPELETLLMLSYHGLGGGPVAVRSSGVAEDLAGASYAGQYETFLNVTGVSEVMQATRACWASAFSPRAASYRQQHGGREAAMGVLVQRMVPADAAGVMFTRSLDDQNVVLIEAADGLGDALVSARVTPDRIRLQRQTLDTLSVEPGDTKAPSEVLSREAGRTIAELGVHIEALLGSPQDIEWAWAGGQPFILQARPITATSLLAAAPAGLTFPNAKPHDLWSRANVGEVFPGVLSPLAWSGIRRSFAGYYQELTAGAGIRSDELGDLFGLFYGRLYTNVGAVHYVVTEHLGFSSDYFEISLGGPGRGEGLPLPHHPLRWGRILRNIPAIIRHLRQSDSLPDRAGLILTEAAEQDRHYTAVDFSSLSLEDLAQANREMSAFLGPQWVFHTRAAGAAMSAFGMLSELCQRWLHDRALANDLMTGITNLRTADIAVGLWAIARRAATDPELRASIEAAGSAVLPDVLRASPAGRQRWSELEAFLQEYGHRANNELDLLEPRWSDDPRPILAIFRGYVLAGPAQDPGAFEARQRRVRDHRERETLRRLTRHPFEQFVPARRAIFRSVLERARRLLPLRENIKHALLRVGRHQRRALLAMGEHFVALGHLHDPEDVFFLEVGELEALAGSHREGLVVRLQRRMRRRHQDRARNLAIDPPEIIVPGQRWAISPAALTSGDTLTGLAASSGLVRGAARVLLSPTEADQLRPGEVLVAPFTDPGWTPVFPLAAAIVMDLGGLLSHGAIIAREYGIPAVVNVRTGTRRIRTGQMVTVDGNRGLVTLEE